MRAKHQREHRRRSTASRPSAPNVQRCADDFETCRRKQYGCEEYLEHSTKNQLLKEHHGVDREFTTSSQPDREKKRDCPVM